MFRNHIKTNSVRNSALLTAAAVTTGFSTIAVSPVLASPNRGAKGFTQLNIDSAIANKPFNHPVTDAELQEMLAKTEGLLHRYCQDPTAGSLDAYSAMVKDLAGLVDDLIKSRPNGTEGKREAAFKSLSVIYFAMLFGGISLPPACALIGTGIGAIAGAPAAEFGGASIPSGTLIGLGSGMILSATEVTIASMIIFSTSMELNEKYPPEAPTPGAATASAAGIQRFAPAGTGNTQQAGPYESLLVNLICTAFSDRLVPVAATWDRTPGLSQAQRDFLRMFRSLQPIIQGIARIRTTHRIAPNALPAQPAAPWMQDVQRILSADTAAAERGWLDAMGIGATTASVQNGRLTISMPSVLRAVGAPATVHTNLAQINLKVGGKGGAFDPYIRCRVTPGDFNVQIGEATIVRNGPDRDHIKVSFTVRHGSRLGSSSLGFRWNGPEADLNGFTPTLTQDAVADAIFSVTGQGLALDRIDVGPIHVGFAFPGLPQNIPGVSDLVKALSQSLETALQDMLKNVLGIGPAMNAFASYPASSVASALNASPQTYGVSHVEKVERLEIHNGKLRAHVQVTAATMASSMPVNNQMIKEVSAAFRNRTGSAGGFKRTGLRPGL